MKRRHFHRDDDARVSDCLARWYGAGNSDMNWLRPAWDYAMTHPYLDEQSLNLNTVWEDESGIANLVFYAAIWERFRPVAARASALVAYGTLQRHDIILHVVIDRVEDLSAALNTIKNNSRDFR